MYEREITLLALFCGFCFNLFFFAPFFFIVNNLFRVFYIIFFVERAYFAGNDIFLAWVIARACLRVCVRAYVS